MMGGATKHIGVAKTCHIRAKVSASEKLQISSDMEVS
jgi:hypothetical protein